MITLRGILFLSYAKENITTSSTKFLQTLSGRGIMHHTTKDAIHSELLYISTSCLSNLDSPWSRNILGIVCLNRLGQACV